MCSSDLLGDALNLLGVRTVHFLYDDATYRELRAGQYRLSILEHLDGIVDIPVAQSDAQLDAAYPGSRFILTVRDKHAWLRSAELHWRLMMQWWENVLDFKRFQELIGAVCYGTVEYNRERFSFVYDAHTKMVLDDFRDRPSDLLVMDISNGDGWDAMCTFLGLLLADPLRSEERRVGKECA